MAEGSRRSKPNVAREAALQRIAQARARRNQIDDDEDGGNQFWPTQNNDARLFDDDDQASSSEVIVEHATATSKATLPERRRLRKVTETVSKSHISVSDDESDDLDDVLSKHLGGLSLAPSNNKPKVVHKVSTRDTGEYKSAGSSFGSKKHAEGEDSGSDSDSEIISSVRVRVHKDGGHVTKDIDNQDSERIILGEGKSQFTLCGKVASKLYQHQREGIRWLWSLHSRKMGGILGDDMGLGKTMQVAAFLAGLLESRLIKRALVVAPKTLIAHWEKELGVVGLARKVRDYSGTSVSTRDHNLLHVLQTGGVLLTTYDIVRNNCKALSGDMHGRDGYGDTSDDIVTWDYVFLDEGHLIKNPSTQRAKSLKDLPSAHRIIISGTPIQNNLREMWALYDFCCPGLLGDRKEFKSKYENMIMSGNDKRATDRQKRIGSAVAQELRDKISPFFLRRLKSEVFPSSSENSSTQQQLSKKNDIIVWLRLSTRQRQMYTAFLSSETAHQSLDGSALAALTVLKKICDHPLLLTKRATEDVVEGMESLNGADAAVAEAMRASLVDRDGESRNEDSCKIVFLMTLLENLLEEGHRTLVFSQTLKMLDVVGEELTKRGHDYFRIDGKTKPCDRQRLVEEFQTDDTVPIFLLTSQVGGLGLTLTGADRVVIVDPAWNPSRDNQSVDRAYRIGQAKDVVIYRLMTCGTLEEKIYRKQVFKGGLMKVATEKKEQFRYFSQQDLRELLTVPKTGFDISVTQQQLYEEHANQFKVDEKLAEHIKFLENQNIAGVSHHDLLFSKTAPELPPASEDEVASACHVKFMGGHFPRDFQRRAPDKLASGDPNLPVPPGKEFWKGQAQRVNLVELQDSDMNKRNMQEQFTRLSTMLSDPMLLAKLPDGGENIRRRMKYLRSELDRNDLAGKLQQQPIDVETFSSG